MSDNQDSEELSDTLGTLRMVCGIISFVGILGNLFTIRFLLKEKISGMTKVLLSAISIYDTAWLISNFIANTVLYDDESFGTFMRENYALVLYMCFHVPKNCSNITLLTVCIERTMCVIKPHHVKRYFTRNLGIFLTAIIFVATSITLLPLGFEFSLDDPSASNSSYRALRYSDFHDANESFYKATHIIVIIFHLCVPVIGVIVCNGYLVIALLKRRRMMIRKDKAKGGVIPRIDRRDLRTTKIVCIVTVIFVVCVSPLGVYMPIKSIMRLPVSSDNFIIILHVSIFLEVIHFSANSFVYFLGSANFRKEFKILCFKICCCGRFCKKRIYPDENGNTTRGEAESTIYTVTTTNKAEKVF